MSVLVVNSGSSSVKFELVDPDSGDSIAAGLVEQIGELQGRVVLDYRGETIEKRREIADHTVGLAVAFEILAGA